ncbi:MAG: DMT family transporter [Oscillospiraceae bacterium]
MEKVKQYMPYLCILGAGTSWGFMGLFSKIILAGGYSSFTVVFIRNFGALAALTVLFLLFDRDVFKVQLKHLPIFAFTGIVSVYLFGICYFTGLKYHSMAVASVLLYTAPGFVIILSRFVWKTPITKKRLLALVMTVFGCACISGVFAGDFATTALGFALGVGSAVTYASYSVVSPFALQHYPPMTCTYYTFVFAGLASLTLLNVEEMHGIVTDPAMLASGIAFAFVSTVIPYLLYTKGLSRVDPGKASIMVSIEPVVAALAGAAFLGEPITLPVALGIACVMAAVVILK